MIEAKALNVHTCVTIRMIQYIEKEDEFARVIERQF